MSEHDGKITCCDEMSLSEVPMSLLEAFVSDAKSSALWVDARNAKQLGEDYVVLQDHLLRRPLRQSWNPQVGDPMVSEHSWRVQSNYTDAFAPTERQDSPQAETSADVKRAFEQGEPFITVARRITPADIWRDDDSPMSHRP